MKPNWPVLAISLCLGLLFLFPAYHIFSPPSGFVFSGVHSRLNSLDSFFQLEVVRQGITSQSWLAENVYSTTIPATQRLLIFYTALGKLSYIFNSQWILLYHLLRVVGVVGFVWILYWFIGIFRQERASKLFILLLTLSSGSILQVYWPEASVFLSLYNPPHVIFALGLMLLILGNFRQGKTLVASIYLFVLGIIHPYDSLAILLILLAWTFLELWQTKRIEGIKAYTLILGVGTLPLILHLFWSYNQIVPRGISLDDIWAQPWSVPVYLGLNFFVAIIGFKQIWQKPAQLNSKLMYLYLWLLVGLAMLYLPVYFRRKLFLGVPIAINIIAGSIVWDLCSVWLARYKARVYIAVLLFFCLSSWTTVCLVTQDIIGFRNHEFPYFISTEHMATYKYLQNCESQQNILAHSRNGIFIPVYSGQKVYVSDWLWTEDQERKICEVATFFSGATTEAWRKAFLYKQNIGYVYYGDKERALGNFRPSDYRYLEKVFSNGKADIYRVTLNALSHSQSSRP